MWSIAAVRGLLALWLCMCSVFQGGSCCEFGWLQYGNHCYRFYTDLNTKYIARLRCMMYGSDLVSLSEEGVFAFVKMHAADAGAHKFWVGLQSVNRTLQWMNGKIAVETPWFQMSHANFTNNHPLMDCYSFDEEHVVKVDCFRQMASVCGYQMLSPSNTTKRTKCHYIGDSFLGEVSGRCMFTRFADRSDAAEKCNEYRASPMDLDDIMKEGLGVMHEHKVLVNDGYRYWTDLTWNGTHVLWKSGRPIDQNLPIPFINGTGSCVTVQFNFTDVLETHLYQTQCDRTMRVVCGERFVSNLFTSSAASLNSSTTERPLNDSPSLSCPEGHNWKTDRVTGYCYWETSFETERLSWIEAETYCQSFGGHLASLHSVEEEKMGLSFQYGSLGHDYWIGLSLDLATETYKWSDGTNLNYSNWAPGHPNHQDKRLRCVAMNASEKHWISSLCGILSWFICKAPRQIDPPTPGLPTPVPLQVCDKEMEIGDPTKSYYFSGSCYFAVSDTVSWHRAKQYCGNQGYTLVSIHSDEEVGFLLKLLYDHSMEGTRAWIGLNTLGSDGALRWTDYTPLDFTYFNKDEPNNYQNQEKCCNMYIGNGLWNDENCNAAMGFICKRKNDTSSTTPLPNTPDPSIGNCKKGWVAHHDRCYLVVGVRTEDRRNWTEAREICHGHGGYLTSIRDEKDQAFLAFLLQTLRTDAWIGLHDTIQSGRYYWLDNSDLRYTRWSPGEPSFFGITEDCVMMVYNRLESGMWQDKDCDRKLGYICQNRKDPSLPEPSYDRGINCLHPEGWLKLDNMCFKMFEGNGLTWEEAETTCRRDGAHLVSVFDKSVHAVTLYLSSEVNRPFWIGLRYKESTKSLGWLNGWPMKMSQWEKGEPSRLTEDTCFASTSEGYWKKADCKEEMPYVCQITTGKSPTPTLYTGSCPSSSSLWTAATGSYCYILDQQHRFDFFTATMSCYGYGTNLISIHSLEQIESLRPIMKPGIRSVRIGLSTSPKGGFMWRDDSPVDFVHWDVGEPDMSTGDQCVEMVADTMRWKMTSCSTKKYFICQDYKSTLYYADPEKAELVDETSGGLSTSALTAILVCVVIAIVVILAAVFYYRRNSGNPARNPWSPFRQQQSVSFENALYNVNSASMEFHD